MEYNFSPFLNQILLLSFIYSLMTIKKDYDFFSLKAIYEWIF